MCLPHAFNAPVSAIPPWNIAVTSGTKKLEWCGYPMVKKFEDIFIRFDRIHERDEQADKRTDRHRMTA